MPQAAALGEKSSTMLYVTTEFVLLPDANAMAEPPCIDVANHLPLASADACTRDLLWQADGLHLNPAGYDRIGEVVAAFLTQPIGV